MSGASSPGTRITKYYDNGRSRMFLVTAQARKDGKGYILKPIKKAPAARVRKARVMNSRPESSLSEARMANNYLLNASGRTKRGIHSDMARKGNYAPNLASYVSPGGTSKYDWPGVDDGVAMTGDRIAARKAAASAYGRSAAGKASAQKYRASHRGQINAKRRAAGAARSAARKLGDL